MDINRAILGTPHSTNNKFIQYNCLDYAEIISRMKNSLPQIYWNSVFLFLLQFFYTDFLKSYSNLWHFLRHFVIFKIKKILYAFQTAYVFFFYGKKNLKIKNYFFIMSIHGMNVEKINVRILTLVVKLERQKSYLSRGKNLNQMSAGRLLDLHARM